MNGLLSLTEDDVYYFDAEAADRPVRFVERYLRHYEGRFAGEPFLLDDFQKRIVRDLFGWKVRATGRRRFTDCFLEAAVGTGKSPLLSAIGLFGLMADGEQGAQVYSLASNYGQARVVFDTAKRFARMSPELDSRLKVVQYEIRHPKSASSWRLVSGKGPGAGCRPSMLLGDEAHQWEGAQAYKDLRDRMSKREQPLVIVATNSGTSRASVCWQLREKAVAALNGTGDPALYPVILKADDDAKTDDPAAWRAANPLLNVTIREEKVAALAAQAMKEGPAAEAEFRRLYLSIWPNVNGERWLDLAQYDAAVRAIDVPAKSPLYVGLDLSLSDDLCAAVFVWPLSATNFYVASKFWMPRATAERYEARDGIPYEAWADAGDVELLEEPTIGSAVQRRIAAHVAAVAKRHDCRAVCYDRYRAMETIAALEAAGLTCVPIAQGWSVSPGCFELERRLKEGSIAFAPNGVARFCVENAQVRRDERGNIWPVKPGANLTTGHTGERGKKIDFVAAAVTALTFAYKHTFPAAASTFRMAVA